MPRYGDQTPKRNKKIGGGVNLKSINDWMNSYESSHQHPTNQLIHKICVPLIVYSVLGILWALPFPIKSQIPWLNGATLVSIISLLFYLKLNLKLFIGMLIKIFFMNFICYKLENTGFLLSSSVTIFIFSWFAQFWGHKIEKKKPSFVEDLFYLLIGPLWALKSLYQKIGIKI